MAKKEREVAPIEECRPKYTEAEVLRIKNEILRDAPDYILAASPEVRDEWLNYKWHRHLADCNPYRYMKFIGRGGEEMVADLKLVSIKTWIMKRGGSAKDANRAQELRYKYVMMPYQILGPMKNKVNKALGIHRGAQSPLLNKVDVVLEWFGRHHTIEDVRKMFEAQFNYEPGWEELRSIYLKYKDVIDTRKAEYILRNKDFKVATETGRLEVLNTLLTDYHLKYHKFHQDGSANMIMKILEQARKEVKGEQLRLTVEGTIDIKASLHGMENVMHTMRGLSINALVIGLTAAKAGLDPSVLIGQLAHSWYKDYNGFNKNVIGTEEIQLPSVLLKTYDWGELRAKSKEFVEDMIPITEAVEVGHDEEPFIEEKRRNVLDRLMQLKQEKSSEGINGMPTAPVKKKYNVKPKE